MTKLKLLMTCAAAGLFAAACAGTQQTQETAKINTPPTSAPATASTPVDELAEARKTYQEYCIRCHKADGTGGPNDFQGNPIKVPNFTTEKMKTVSDAIFTKYITEGEEGEMPSFKDRLTPEEIKGLVKMIRTDFQGMGESGK